MNALASRPASPSPRAPRLAALALLALAAACATTKRATGEVVWPLPPEKPRIRFVRSFASESDLRTSAWASFVRGLTGANPNAIQQPTGLALSPDERHLYVTAAMFSSVLDVDLESGAFRRVAAAEGARPARPVGVAVDAEGNLYVADSKEAVVLAYRPDGALLRRIGKGTLERPTAIAVDRRRQVLYVVESGTTTSPHHAVEVFALDGRHLKTFGGRGTDPGRFNFPTQITVAPNGDLFVSDTLNFRVQVLSPDGDVVAIFGEVGAGPRQFLKVKGIAVDAFANLHVVDGEAGIVQILNSRYEPLMAYGGVGESPGKFLVPTAIAIDSKNRIYVADYVAQRINEYVLFNTSAADSFASEPPAGAAPAAPSPAPAGR